MWRATIKCGSPSVQPNNGNNIMENKSYLRLDGNTVELVEERVQKTMGLQDFFDGIVSETPIGLFLPRDCIYFQRTKNHDIFVIEQKPGLVQIRYESTYRQLTENNDLIRGEKRYRIPVPYTYMVLSVAKKSNNVLENRMFMTTSPLTSKEQNVYQSYLPNTWDLVSGQFGRVCTSSLNYNMSETTIDSVSTFKNAFWNSQFNYDIATRIPSELFDRISTKWYDSEKFFSDDDLDEMTNRYKIKHLVYGDRDNANRISKPLIVVYLKLLEDFGKEHGDHVALTFDYSKVGSYSFETILNSVLGGSDA